MKRPKKILKILLLVTVIAATLVLAAGCASLSGKAKKQFQSTDRPIYTFVPTQTDSATSLSESTSTAAPAPVRATAPSQAATRKPTDAPTQAATVAPTAAPTKTAIKAPTAAPTKVPEPETTTPYVGNANSKKFHRTGCSSVTDMKKGNRVPLSSREDAISRGYTPCQRCNP